MTQRILAVLATLALGLPQALAQENFELGRMWLFERPPLAHLATTYGFRPTQEWLDAVRLASLRFGRGCSASFVSPRGLIVTNHHCVRGHIARVQAENDWVRDGFVAADLEHEVAVPGLTVQQLAAIRDVTAEIAAGVGPHDAEADVAARRERNRAEVLRAARELAPDLDHQIVELFGGAMHQLYSYKVYRDVRLVMAPHLQASHFGGDPDNFTYPRFGIDFAFCRAYEDGAPADTSKSFFRFSATGPRDGELVFVTGNPGSTERLLTKAQFEYQRDVRLPRIRQMLDNRLAILRSMVAADPGREKELRTDILGLENSQKAYRGMHEGLLDDALMARKDGAERAFRDRVAKDADLAAQFGDVWDRLASIARDQRELEPRLEFQTEGGSIHLIRALLLVRAVEALQAGSDADRILEVLAAQPNALSPVQQAFFVDHLHRAREWLPGNDLYLRAVLRGREPDDAAKELAGSSRIGDDAFVRELLDGGAAALRGSSDPAIRIARVLAPMMRSNRAVERTLEARESVQMTRIGRALFAAYRDEVTPDATFTLRFSDGVVDGYPYNGTLAPWRTVFYGMFARNQEFDDRHPFDLPKLWKDRRDKLDLTKAVNFVCTNDSTGGNSGSPVIDVERNLVGLLFDGNIECLPNDFLFDDSVARSVCVHVQAILEALTKVYDAQRIADELLATKSSTAGLR